MILAKIFEISLMTVKFSHMSLHVTNILGCFSKGLITGCVVRAGNSAEDEVMLCNCEVIETLTCFQSWLKIEYEKKKEANRSNQTKTCDHYFDGITH